MSDNTTVYLFTDAQCDTRTHPHRFVYCCIITQQNVTFWVCRPVEGPMTHKFEFWRDFCTVHLATKFHHSMFNHSEVIMLTNKQTNVTENIHFTSLCYASG